jgi:hydroxyacylglutathione hydrolase
MAANKIGLQDEFVLMSKAFGHKVDDFHIDIHLHHGTLIDVGGYVLQTLHTPGHCSGSVCLYEPEQQLLFTGDTIFAGGTLGGIFPSGNISDYVGTLQQLRNMKIKEIYPGHGRISTDPAADFDRAIRGSIQLMSDTRALFSALDSRAEFGYIMKSIAAYSRRV